MILKQNLCLTFPLKIQSKKNHFKEKNISDENKLQELSKLTKFYVKISISDRISCTGENK